MSTHQKQTKLRLRKISHLQIENSKPTITRYEAINQDISSLNPSLKLLSKSGLNINSAQYQSPTLLNKPNRGPQYKSTSSVNTSIGSNSSCNIGDIEVKSGVVQRFVAEINNKSLNSRQRYQSSTSIASPVGLGVNAPGRSILRTFFS